MTSQDFRIVIVTKDPDLAQLELVMVSNLDGSHQKQNFEPEKVS